jgi:hypothetical protein
VRRFGWLAALWLASCSAKPGVPSEAPAAQSKQVSIFLSAELKGYLGPCGCSENMRGGIARAAHQLEEARKEGHPVLYLDSGDALFGESQIAEAAVPQQERKAKALAEATKAMGLALRARGPLDDARGQAFRQALGLPELGPSGIGRLQAGSVELAVVEGATAAELGDRAKAARAAGAQFVIGLWRTAIETALQQASGAMLGVDLAVAVKAKDELSGEENKVVRGAVPLVQVQTKGRSMLRLDLYPLGSGPFELLRGADDVEREIAVIEQRIEFL